MAIFVYICLINRKRNEELFKPVNMSDDTRKMIQKTLNKIVKEREAKGEDMSWLKG